MQANNPVPAAGPLHPDRLAEQFGHELALRKFQHCPQCGHKRLQSNTENRLACSHCGWRWYSNPACAAGAIILNPAREMLLLRRSMEPARGQLSLPGGFVNQGESAEQAILREIREETRLECEPPTYLLSFPNFYRFDGMAYWVLDLFFVTHTAHPADARLSSESTELCWIQPARIDDNQIAFYSGKVALAEYLRQTG
ncbi:MAG: NUDIX domain-containing protein [Leptospiraceae bacterium]|nr:NUDIX domain-containing protein [Leptospiraceae bacterium]